MSSIGPLFVYLHVSRKSKSSQLKTHKHPFCKKKHTFLKIQGETKTIETPETFETFLEYPNNQAMRNSNRMFSVATVCLENIYYDSKSKQGPIDIENYLIIKFH